MNYAQRAEKETKEAMDRVGRAVSSGMSPTDAINRNAHTAESYSAALKAYGLKADIPD